MTKEKYDKFLNLSHRANPFNVPNDSHFRTDTQAWLNCLESHLQHATQETVLTAYYLIGNYGFDKRSLIPYLPHSYSLESLQEAFGHNPIHVDVVSLWQQRRKFPQRRYFKA